MLKLYRSSNLNELAYVLQEGYNTSQPENPLQKETIILQNYGMERWLKMYIAQQEGVVANLDIEFPAEYIWKLFRRLDVSIPENLPSDKEPLHFAIFDIVQSEKYRDSLAPLYSYIGNGAGSVQTARVWELSARIADLFDRYLVYRPEMLLKWQQNELQTGNSAERWQSSLWNILQKRWNRSYPERKWHHRAELYKVFVNTIETGDLNENQFPKRVSVFGISALPPTFLKIFIRLSKLVDVHFYWLGSVQKGNDAHPLIESFGRQAKEFLQCFHQYANKDGTIAKNFVEKKLQENQASPDTLLSELQNRIIENDINRPDVGVSADQTIQIHSCNSPFREVEVLYDQLLALFDENPDLKPEDVVIMSPDIEQYAPLIDAVFGSVEADLPEIPFSIADRGGGYSSPVTHAFTKILELLESRFKVSEVMELLQMPVIQEQMNIDYEEVNRVQRWIDVNNIHWGIDGDFKLQLGLIKNEHFTWQAGLSRMMLGYAMHQPGREFYEGKMPYDTMGGTDSAELLGQFYELLQNLFELQRNIRRVKTTDAWISVLNEIVHTFLPLTAEYEEGILVLRDCIASLQQSADEATFQRKIPFRIMQSYLSQKLAGKKKSGYLGQGVTFSSMVAVQNIPSKVIGLLGMDEAEFPRNNLSSGFNLMEYNPKRGDPDQAEDDRYLFLNALTSVRQTLYISYTGQSNQKDVQIPSSVLVSELLNAVEEEFNISREAIITEHRLQPFSSQYFLSNNSKLFSYSKLHCQTAGQLLQSDTQDPQSNDLLFDELPSPESESKSVGLQSLISFYQHPSKYVLQNVMGVYLFDEKLLDEDSEPFELSGLTRYQINQELLEVLLDEHPPDTMLEVFKARDLLPAGFWGERYFNDQVEVTCSFYDSIKNELEGRRDAIEVDLSVQRGNDLHRIQGELTEIHGSRLVLYRLGKIRPKDSVEFWIKHLIWCAINNEDEGQPSHYYGYDQKEGKIEHQVLEPVSEAKTLLAELIKHFQMGLQKPFPFFPDTSFGYAERLIKKNEKHEAALEKAQKKWKGNKHQSKIESKDPYHKLIFKKYRLSDDPEFVALATSVLKPFFESLKQS